MSGKLSIENLKKSIANILENSAEKQRKFVETVELQIGLKDYDTQRDKRFSGSVKLPNVPRPRMQICIIGDAAHCEQAEKLGIAFKTIEDLKKLNKNKKLVKKLADSYDAFLASQTLITQIPRVLGPGLNKAGKFPTALASNDNLSAKIAELQPFFPFGLTPFISSDTAPFVRASTREVLITLVEAMVLVVLVIFVFLQNFRATLIPAIAVPVVLLGTLYPLLLDALGMGKISVGPPYFDSVFLPLMVPTIFLMGVGPMARWKETSVPDLASRLKWAAGVSVVMALLTGWLAGSIHLLASLGLLMAYWIVSSVATDIWERVRPEGKGFAEIRRKAGQIPRALVGMMVAHIGVAMFCLGVTMVKTYEVESDVKMSVGDSTTVRGYAFTFKGVKQIQGPNYDATRADIEISRNGSKITQLSPEKRVYRVQQNPMTEAAIAPGLTGDLYVSMGEEVEGGAWIVRVYVKPFIDWIWGGCLVMAFGGFLAVTDRRYRRKAGVAV